MEPNYDNKMAQLGYNQLVCDIFLDWENVKDEILIPNRKAGSGNGTIHVFLGAADSKLQEEFPSYYESVASGEDTSIGAIEVKHYFMISNIVSMLGYVCNYLRENDGDINSFISNTLDYINDTADESGLLSTKSLFKLSVGSNKLRPYFKQFESDGVFSKLIRQILLPNSSYKISLYKNEDGEYAAFWLIGFDWQSSFDADSSTRNLGKSLAGRNVEEKSYKTLQQIYYGAPGTGKSHTINELTEGESVIRTTFHPDSDYSTFVGAYKPTMGLLPICDELGQPMKIGSTVLHKEQIIYEFVDQAFLQAYVQAWKFYAENSDTAKKQYLIIEEINRGNCAQIFGDLFQLLDRNDYGFSVYPINADKDMKKHLEKAFKGVRIDNADSINQHYKGRNVVKEVLDGDILLLPNNLYIWATMNTSDQSLFPIDSAFKRRWEWKYVPISNAGKAWKICVNGKEYDWWSFIEKINNKIWNVTKSEDKKLGYFFCKADRKITEGDEDNNVISADGFVGKVLFYVYNDVYKDYGFDDDIFKDKEDNNSDLLFQTFFMANGKPNEAKIEVFLKNLEVKMASEVAGTNEEDNVYEIEDEDAGLEEDVVKENKVSDTNAPYKVTFPDGEVICEEYGWDTYISALRKIGLDKALPFGQIFTRMNKTLPLITDKRIQDQGPYKYIKIDGYYVLSGTDSQHRLLKKMNQDLGLGLIIE